MGLSLAFGHVRQKRLPGRGKIAGYTAVKLNRIFGRTFGLVGEVRSTEIAGYPAVELNLIFGRALEK